MVGLKLGLTFGGALTTGILSSNGYNSDLAIQSIEAVNAIKLSISIYPAIPFLVGIGLLFFYEINKKMESQIEEELLLRRG